MALTSYEAAGAEPVGSGARYDIGRYEYSTLNNGTLFLLYDAAGHLTRDSGRPTSPDNPPFRRPARHAPLR